jgi:zinc protease
VRRRSTAIALLLIAIASSPTADAQIADWPSERPPRPLAARDVKFPPYALKTLPNGLQVIAVAHHEQPAVSLRLMVRAGGAQDPADRPGVAALVAALLDQGTTTRSAEQIAHTIDSIGGVIGAGSGTEYSFVQAIVMKDSFGLGLDLVSDIAKNPGFAAQEIELQRKQMLSSLTVSYDDPEYLAGVVFERLVYGPHRYGRPDSGTPASLAAITRDDLVRFHKTWFGANNAILAVVGDVTTDEAFAGAERAFGAWGKAESAAAVVEVPPAPTRRLLIIDRPGAVQTEIRVGNTSLPRKHRDYLALDLAVKILGGEGGNRLHRVLRSDRGLTYGASADLHAFKDAGTIVADTDTRSDSTGEALRLIVDEMWRLQRDRVGERELSDAQAYLTGSFPLTIETPSAIAAQVLSAVFFGLDLEELQNFRERVNAVTVEDIQRVARTYLHPDRLSIVLVGDASRFEKQLAGAGFAQFERIPVSELDLSVPGLRRRSTGAGGRVQPIGFRGPAEPVNTPLVASAFRRPSTRLGTPLSLSKGRKSTAGDSLPAKAGSHTIDGATQTAQREDADALIARAIRGKGGLARLKAIRTIQALSDTTVEAQGKRLTIPTTIRIRYPGAFRIDSEMPAGPVSQVFDSGTFWIVDARGANVAPPLAAQSMRGNIQRDAVALLLALADGRVKARRIDDIAVDGRLLPALDVPLKPGGPLTLLLDPDSGLIVRERYPAPDATGQIEERFADYRDVDGVKVAFSVTVTHPQLGEIVRVMRKVTFNVPLDPSLFAKPS